MRIYSYVIEHDLGFAPNPFHGVCTLACCKPKIREWATEGDYVVGTGASKPGLLGHICFWMRIDEIRSFDEYWSDPRFRRKRPIVSASAYLRYGDNIYHSKPDGTGLIQEDSFHSLPGGALSLADLQRDTGTTQKVLIGRDFAYWGRSGIKLPRKLGWLVKKGPSHKCRFTPEQIEMFLSWLGSQPARGRQDEPAHWQYLKV